MPAMSRWKMAAATATVATLAAGCTGSPDDADVPSNGISIGIAEPSSLLPTNSTEANGGQVLASLFAPLVSFDKDNRPVPVAAESVTGDKANRVWTIKLKPGFTFSNGEPVTADSYLNAWNYGAYGPNDQRASYVFNRIEGFADLQSIDPDGDGPKAAPTPKAKALSGLRKTGDTTFTVTLSAGFASWPSVLASDAFYPLPNAAFSSAGVLAEGFAEAPIGNGPFKLKGKWQRGEQIQVERVAGFGGPAPKVDGITWKIYTNLAAQYADLTGGKLDVATRIPAERLDKATSELGDRLVRTPGAGFTSVAFPFYEEAYQNRDVRRALSMAINREELAGQALRGTELPATSFVSPVVPGARADSCGKFCEYDPAQAKQLYAAAKGPNLVKISYNKDGGHQAWVDAMCAQITASLTVDCAGQGEATFADLLAKVRNREPVGLIRLPWTLDYPLMESYLGPLYTTDGSSNYYGFSNTAFDSLVRQGNEAPTGAAAVKFWQQAEDILAQEMPVLPLRFGQNVFGHAERVAGVTMDVFGRVDVYQVDIAS